MWRLRLIAIGLVLALGTVALVEAATPDTAEAQSRRRSRRHRRHRHERREASAEASTAGTPPVETGGDAGSAQTEATAASDGEAPVRSGAIDFEDRVVRGERAGAGSVVLFERTARQLAPLVRRRTRFVDASVRELLGDGSAPPPQPPPRAPREERAQSGATPEAEPASDGGEPRERRRRRHRRAS